MTQLPLPFPDRPDYASADFLQAPSNAEALAWLRDAPGWPDGRLVIWGDAGCGKTHLLSIWAARHGGSVQGAPLLLGLPEPPRGGGVAIDEADRPADEEALLHRSERGRGGRACQCCLPPGLPPARWALRLPDLLSRVRGAAAVRIGEPEDELLRALLARLLSARQLAVSAETQAWLLRRLPRTAGAVREAAALLDREALSKGGAVTRAIAARVLATLEGAPSCMRATKWPVGWI